LLDCLPGRYRQALILAEYQGLSRDDIAERLDIAASEAESRLRRGREMVREAMWDWCHLAAERDGRTLPYQPSCPTCVAS
jgi:RNA polymerase sigma-70 factor (ECF subfamily)